jgi:uncharacterized protein (DUF58 family)
VRAQAALDARALHLRARRDVSTVLAGAYRSAFRGRGLTFEELRDYVPGDDVRWIEWNATARLGRPISKRMREERDLVLALLVDVSASLEWGFAGATKAAAARRAAAALAMTALLAQDRVALATFSGGLVDTLSPARGALQLERALRALSRDSGGRTTDARRALDWAVDTLPRHTVVVLLSDLLFPDPGAALRNCAHKHELIALRVADPADAMPPGVAPARVAPAELGPRALLRAGRDPSAPLAVGGAPLPEAVLRALGVETGTLWTGSRLVPSLHRFFAERARRMS